MNKPKERTDIKEQAGTISKRLWVVLLAVSIPFLLLTAAFFLKAESSDERLLIVAIFLFAFGLAFVAFRFVSYTFISRYLDKIMELDTAKSDFISVASHQLKSPVSSLKYTMDVFYEALEEEDWETVEEFSKDIKTSVNRLNSLTHQLLDVARAESGSLEGKPEKFYLVEKIDSIKTELKPIFKGENVTVSAQYEIDQTVSIKVDPDFFYNVLTNLLTNASSYAPEGGEITITVQKKNKMAEVSVINRAMSLQKGDLDNVFAKFDRGNIENQGDSEGAGLGLFIAKTYVENWEGSISAEVIDGADKVVFSFTVPIADLD